MKPQIGTEDEESTHVSKEAFTICVVDCAKTTTMSDEAMIVPTSTSTTRKSKKSDFIIVVIVFIFLWLEGIQFVFFFVLQFPKVKNTFRSVDKEKINVSFCS